MADDPLPTLVTVDHDLKTVFVCIGTNADTSRFSRTKDLPGLITHLIANVREAERLQAEMFNMGCYGDCCDADPAEPSDCCDD